MFRTIEWEPVVYGTKKKVGVYQSLRWPAPDGNPICAKTSNAFDLDLEKSTQELLDACDDVKEVVKRLPKTEKFLGIFNNGDDQNPEQTGNVIGELDSSDAEEITECEFYLQWTRNKVPGSNLQQWYTYFGRAIPLPQGNTGMIHAKNQKLTIVAKANTADEVKVMATFILVNADDIEKVAFKKTGVEKDDTTEPQSFQMNSFAPMFMPTTWKTLSNITGKKKCPEKNNLVASSGRKGY